MSSASINLQPLSYVDSALVVAKSFITIKQSLNNWYLITCCSISHKTAPKMQMINWAVEKRRCSLMPSQQILTCNKESQISTKFWKNIWKKFIEFFKVAHDFLDMHHSMRSLVCKDFLFFLIICCMLKNLLILFVKVHITFAQTLLFHIFVRYIKKFDSYTRLEMFSCTVKILRLPQAGTRTFRTNLNGNDSQAWYVLL